MGDPPRLPETGDETRIEHHRSSAVDVERLHAELTRLRVEDRWVRRVGVVVCAGPALGGGNVG